jgi:hypothetical protein
LTASSHPFGFHPTGQTPAPMPLRHVPAMQAPAAPAPTVVALPQPVFPMCVLCGNRRDLAPRGQERYRSGARVLVCKGGCHVGPVEAAAGVLGAAMAQGAGTPQELAQAEHDAGLLFDPQRAQEIAAAAVEQFRTETRADMHQAREDRHSLDWFHSRYLAVGRLCAGRHPDYCLTVSEVLTAIDGKTDDTPLRITWDGVVAPPAGDRPGEPTLVGCTTARGGSAVLALDDEQRVDLAVRLLAVVPPAEACATPGCGLADGDLDASDPTVWGWIRLDVAGAEDDPRWWCSPACATAAMAAAGAELAAVDRLAVITPAPDTAVVEDDVARCQRCGCTEGRACIGGCHWVPNPQRIVLCSACASSEDLAFAAFRPQSGQGADA